MKLSLHTDYALRFLMFLVSRPGRTTIAEVAEFYGISKDHLAKVTQQMVRLGYVRSIRGINGGIELIRERCHGSGVTAPCGVAGEEDEVRREAVVLLHELQIVHEGLRDVVRVPFVARAGVKIREVQPCERPGHGARVWRVRASDARTC